MDVIDASTLRGVILAPDPGGEWEPIELAATSPGPTDALTVAIESSGPDRAGRIARALRERGFHPAVAAVVAAYAGPHDDARRALRVAGRLDLADARSALAGLTAPAPRTRKEATMTDYRVHVPGTGRTFDARTGAEITPAQRAHPARSIGLAYEQGYGLPADDPGEWGPIPDTEVRDRHGRLIDPPTPPEAGNVAARPPSDETIRQVQWLRREYPHLYDSGLSDHDLAKDMLASRPIIGGAFDRSGQPTAPAAVGMAIGGYETNDRQFCRAGETEIERQQRIAAADSQNHEIQEARRWAAKYTAELGL
ncbi:hypothetical protein H7X46_11350 [Pseudonocardia sp. C8]|uniref:hypothetical protein n=1 Tax=Pseudonocardia sp. C8 TaxID=2762759 RepID=UPI001642B12A|nr:hypothetical protein [Pseudonocardia sp. C8]MBC3191656.1 hypothetical protein [Pseudonocardia sp. C8]